MPAIQISETALVTAMKEHVSCEIEGEAVILNMKSGVYYGLNSVGNAIWNLIQEPRKVQDILSALVSQYEVERAECYADLNQVLQEMLSAGLIEVTGDGSQ